MKHVRNRLIAGVKHADPIVRDACLHILTEDRDGGLDVTRAALAAIEREGWEAAFTYPHQLGPCAQDAATMEWVLQVLEAPAEAAPGMNTRSHLLSWLTRGPVEVLEGMEARILAAADRLGREEEAIGVVGALRRFADRRRFARLGVEALLEEVARICARCGEQKDFPHQLVAALEDAVEALAERSGEGGERLAKQARRWLRIEPDDAPAAEWLLGAGIQLVGRLGLRDTVDDLLGILDLDSEWWNEEIQLALVRMADASVAHAVAEAYAGFPWEGRLYLSSLFERYRDAAIEPAVQSLLEGEEDDGHRVSLAEGLALYGTATATAAAERVLEEDPDDPDRVTLYEALFAMDVLAGNPPVGRQARWRRWLEDERKRSARLLGHVGTGAGDGVVPSNILPFIPEAAKVGRNDPCPCGSGRKYKKCCLGKETKGTGPPA
ncbi:MAG: SEC-C metal-binding domain-containing protein [Opitutales bacterium]